MRNERQPPFEIEVPKPAEFLIVEGQKTRQLLCDWVERLIERVRMEKPDALVFLEKILSITLLSKLAAEISSVPWSDASDDAEALRRKMVSDADTLGESCANSVCSTSCSLMNHRAMVIGEQAAQYADPKRVVRRAAQLRDEMRAIAEMPVSVE